MGKKYLLYIHDELFGEEKEKSGLVNSLLAAHYHGPAQLIELKTQDDKVKVVKQASIPRSIIKTKYDALTVIKETFPEAVCKGHPNFRRNCGLKGCEYRI